MVVPPAPAFITNEPHVLGFDVSHHQVYVEFKALYESGYRFCFLKATEGNTFRDKLFSVHVVSALEANLVVGAYHFAKLKRGDVPFAVQGRKQAQFFIRTMSLSLGRVQHLPPVLDVEWHDSLKESKVTTTELTEFIESFYTEAHNLGVDKLIVYCGPSFYKQYIQKPLPYILWLVSGYNKKFKPTRTIPEWHATFYQFTSKQPAPYQSTKRPMFIDANVFYGTEDDLRSLLVMPKG